MNTNTEKFQVVNSKGDLLLDRWFETRAEAEHRAGDYVGGQVKLFRTIVREDVISVYSGKAGRCCCGCSGKHSYAKKHQKAAGEYRGYPVTDSEVNDRQVTRIVNLLNAAPGTKDEGDLYSLEVNGRLYIAYMREGAAGDPPKPGEEPPVCGQRLGGRSR